MTVEISPLTNPFLVKSATLIIFETISLPSLLLKLLALARMISNSLSNLR